MKRIPDLEVWEAIEKQRHLQKDLLSKLSVLLNSHKIEGVVLEKKVRLPNGRTATYKIVREVQKFLSREFSKVLGRELGIAEAGEVIEVFNSDSDSDYNDWKVELVTQYNGNLSQHYLLASRFGKIVWYWSDNGISSYYSDEISNKILLDGCKLLEQVRNLANL